MKMLVYLHSRGKQSHININTGAPKGASVVTRIETSRLIGRRAGVRGALAVQGALVVQHEWVDPGAQFG
jgi:hypothetical protein